MGSMFSNTSDDYYVMNLRKPYVIPEEIPRVVSEAEGKIKELKQAKLEFLQALKEKEIPKDIHFKNDEFQVNLEGNGELTKNLIQKRFPQCEITVGEHIYEHSFGFGRNEKTDYSRYDALIFKCKY